jgi:hypothetical protein
MNEHIDPTAPIEICGKWFFWDARTRTHKPADSKPAKPSKQPSKQPRAAGDRDLAPVPAPAQQRTKRKKQVRRGKDCAISQRVDIEVRTYRVHTCDTEAVFIKHALDAIVDRGVISDDSAAEVASIKFYAAEKVAAYEQEGHLITIRPCK